MQNWQVSVCVPKVRHRSAAVVQSALRLRCRMSRSYISSSTWENDGRLAFWISSSRLGRSPAFPHRHCRGEGVHRDTLGPRRPATRGRSCRPQPQFRVLSQPIDQSTIDGVCTGTTGAQIMLLWLFSLPSVPCSPAISCRPVCSGWIDTIPKIYPCICYCRPPQDPIE